MLDRIVETKWEELQAAVSSCSREEMAERARQAPPPRPFASALRGDTVAVIAEIKKASPSAGLIRPDYDPVEIARAYEIGGASALSVLTDATYFQGSLDALRQVRQSVALPVLRKDFTVDSYQVYEARAAGADAVLLIVAVLDEERLRTLLTTATELGMDALVEVHTRAEMELATRVGAQLIGINNRNLKTREFVTSLQVTADLAALAPPAVTLAALSGISTRADVERMARDGAHAVLVGESLMRQPDVAAAARKLVGVPLHFDAQVGTGGLEAGAARAD